MSIHRVKEYQEKCKEKLDPKVFDYFFSGSDQEITLKNNTNAYNLIKICPRVLKDISKIQLSTTILGHKLDLPFGVAPFAMQKLLTQKGQLVSAEEASKQNTAYGLSMLSTTKMQKIKQVNPNGLKIMQLYFLKNASFTQQVIKNAEEKGFKALAITVDTQIFGKRRRDARNNFSPQVTLQIFKELSIDIQFNNPDKNKAFIHTIQNQLTWDFIKNIKKKTSLKIILKGLLDPDDAQIAHNCGVDAIWISNHGGRQLDTGPATLWALPGIKQRLKKLKSKIQIYVDGGIWRGSDIFKCLALGADFVFVGRGFLYSLIDGQQGIHNSFQLYKKELLNTMMLCGVKNIKQINQSYIFNSSAISLTMSKL